MQILKDLTKIFLISVIITLLVVNDHVWGYANWTFTQITNFSLVHVAETHDANFSVNADTAIIDAFRQHDFESVLTERIEQENGHYGIYIQNLETGETLTIGDMEKYPPASTFKIYTALLVLKDIEDEKITWNSTVKFSKNLWVPGPGTYFKESDVGKRFTIKNLLWRMIVQSDNTAQSMLFAYLKRDNIEKRLKPDLGLGNTSLATFETTPEDMGKTLGKLYNYEIVNEELSNHLIELMSQTYARNRIKAGVPAGTKVANKGGTLPTSKHDVGIIFGEETTYILVVYSDDIVESKAIKTIVDTSKLAWKFFESQVTIVSRKS